MEPLDNTSLPFLRSLLNSSIDENDHPHNRGNLSDDPSLTNRLLHQMMLRRLCLTKPYVTAVGLLMWGNLLVIFVYGKTRRSANRLYITVLAITDFLTCVNYVCVKSTEILTQHPLPVNGYYISNFLRATSLYYQFYLLSVIALTRYLSVCCSTKHFLQFAQAQRYVRYLFGGALLMSLATILLIYYRHDNVAEAVAATAAGIVSVNLLHCYFRVGLVIFQRARGRRFREIHPLPPPIIPGHNLPEHRSRLGDRQLGQDAEPDVGMCNTLDVNTLRFLPPRSRRGDNRAGQGSSGSNRIHIPPINRSQTVTKKKPWQNSSLILFTVTVAFCAIYITGRVVAEVDEKPCFLKDIYMLNCVVNPIIYSFLSPGFRKNTIRLITSWCYCKAPN